MADCEQIVCKSWTATRAVAVTSGAGQIELAIIDTGTCQQMELVLSPEQARSVAGLLLHKAMSVSAVQAQRENAKV